MEGAPEVAASSLEGILTNIGSLFTSAMGWMGTVGTAVVSNPILLVGVVVGFIYVGVNLFKRLMHV